MYLEETRYHKYEKRPCDYNGYIYDSAFEANYAKELDEKKEDGEIKDWTKQFKVEVRIDGVWMCNYYVDFKVEHNDGSLELIECKGRETELWIMKRKLLELIWLPQHPEFTYKVVKERISMWRKRPKK